MKRMHANLHSQFKGSVRGSTHEKRVQVCQEVEVHTKSVCKSITKLMYIRQVYASVSGSWGICDEHGMWVTRRPKQNRYFEIIGIQIPVKSKYRSFVICCTTRVQYITPDAGPCGENDNVLHPLGGAHQKSLLVSYFGWCNEYWYRSFCIPQRWVCGCDI